MELAKFLLIEGSLAARATFTLVDTAMRMHKLKLLAVLVFLFEACLMGLSVLYAMRQMYFSSLYIQQDMCTSADHMTFEANGVPTGCTEHMRNSMLTSFPRLWALWWLGSHMSLVESVVNAKFMTIAAVAILTYGHYAYPFILQALINLRKPRKEEA